MPLQTSAAQEGFSDAAEHADHGDDCPVWIKNWEDVVADECHSQRDTTQTLEDRGEMNTNPAIRWMGPSTTMQRWNCYGKLTTEHDSDPKGSHTVGA